MSLMGIPILKQIDDKNDSTFRYDTNDDFFFLFLMEDQSRDIEEEKNIHGCLRPENLSLHGQNHTSISLQNASLFE